MIAGYRKVIGERLLILATFANLLTLVGRESRRSERQPLQEEVLGVHIRDV